MNEFLFAVIALAISAVSFFCGLKLSDHYHSISAYEQKIALQKQYARLRAGVDADDPAQPYVYVPPRRRFSVPKEFADHLKANGSATIAVDKTKQIS